MKIPFTKAHGAKNDFLLTWAERLPNRGLREIAIAICDRHTGVGADGWLMVKPGTGGAHAAIRLLNSDGSEAELSGNGTRCAAAFLIDAQHASREIRILTGAGPKDLRLISRSGNEFVFEMDMGQPKVLEHRVAIPAAGGAHDATLLDVGNPQCAVFVQHFDFDWRAAGAALERHDLFPNRTNVSFIRRVDEHTIDVRFFERGAGETMSSGTGSTGAAAAAVARGLVENPVHVLTPAGTLELNIDAGGARMIGPAEIVAVGEYYWHVHS
jgi:diaminopimelate epimerase